MKRLIYETGRLDKEEEDLLEKHNLFKYQLRGADMGGGHNIEKNVWANHQADWITNFEVEFYENCDFINDEDFDEKYKDVEYVSLEEVILNNSDLKMVGKE